MKVVIIEDEELASNRLERLLKQQIPQVQILAVLDSVKVALAWFKQNLILQPPDLIFLDIHLGDGLSFSIFKEVEINIPIIFTTAYDEYALKAFEVNSVDYILKPITEESLHNGLEKWQKRRQPSVPMPDYQQLATSLGKLETPRFQSRFMVKTGARIRVIQIEQIAYFYSKNSLTFIKTFDGFDFLTEQTLTDLEKIVDPKAFHRVTRKLLVSLDSIDQMHTHFKGRIKLMLKPAFEEDIIVSTDKTTDFKQWLSW
ncbi:hypothetical protein BKI52_01430 [marine bacterium AO1-C]|nr:hypothetical protein BKI52_01430 [marine bacterium AO1-C]